MMMQGESGAMGRCWMRWVGATVVAVAMVGCGHTRSVKRLSADMQTDLSGSWNDTDARLTADALIQQCFAGGWLSAFVDDEGRKPSVRVRGIVNKTDEHIDAQVFIKSIERAMINSGKVRVLAQEGAELSAIRREQDDSAAGFQSDDSAVSVANETGADFVVSVRMASIIDQIQGEQTKFYKVNFELLSASTGEKAWIGDYEIKKHIQQARVGW